MLSEEFQDEFYSSDFLIGGPEHMSLFSSQIVTIKLKNHFLKSKIIVV